MKLLLAAFAALILQFSIPHDVHAQTGLSVTGQVLEVKDVDQYSYLHLKTADGDIWAAVNRSPVKTGSVVTVVNAMAMRDFESRTLKRTFDRILLGNLGKTPAGAKLSSTAGIGMAPPAAAAAAKAPAGAAAPASAGGANPHGGTFAVPAGVGDVKVPKATGPNAHTVAEIVTGRAALKGKQVVVRGKVVKFTPAIMGKNWVHLRDGSGSDKDRTSDVAVTTKDAAKVGDVVVASGVVHTDVDIGAGYSYPVLIEDAKLSK